jgi:hypothetical protein
MGQHSGGPNVIGYNNTSNTYVRYQILQLHFIKLGNFSATHIANLLTVQSFE